jgi:hypothetical protein
MKALKLLTSARLVAHCTIARSIGCSLSGSHPTSTGSFCGPTDCSVAYTCLESFRQRFPQGQPNCGYTGALGFEAMLVLSLPSIEGCSGL